MDHWLSQHKNRLIEYFHLTNGIFQHSSSEEEEEEEGKEEEQKQLLNAFLLQYSDGR